MDKVHAASKYYIYGCSQLLSDLRELIDNAADFEEQGRSAEEWLRHHGLNCKWESQDMHLSWGAAINMLISNRTNELLEIREDSIGDYPF